METSPISAPAGLQNPASVAITGGTINGATIGATTPASGVFTTLANAGGAIIAGTYTPSLTNTTNVAASTSQVCSYVQVGNFVMVFGGCSIDPTSASVSTVLKISLPVASNLALSTDLDGVGFSPIIFGLGGAVYADQANDLAILQFIADATAANNAWTFVFGYRVL